MKSRQRFAVVLLILILATCKQNHNQKTTAIEFKNSLNKVLIDKLHLLIDRQDSLSNSNNIYSRHTSFWIVFYKKKNRCYIDIIACFDKYNNQTDGYIYVNDKIVTFYGKKTGCSTRFVKWDEVETGVPKNLNDTPGFYEPYMRQYLVNSQDSLTLIYEGY